MNLLKAIYTLLKKLSLFAIFLSLPSFLFSTPLRVTILSQSESYKDLLEDVLNTFQYSLNNEVLIERVKSRLETESDKTFYKSLDTYLENENFKALENLERKDIKLDNLTLNIVDINLQDNEKSSLFEIDKDAIDYIKNKNNLDLVLIAKVSNGDFGEIKLYFDDVEILDSLYSEKFKNTEEDLLKVFLPLLSSRESHLYKLNLPTVSTLTIDGNSEPLYFDYVVLENGEHSFSYSAPGYYQEERTIALDGKIDEIELPLTRVLSNPLLVSSVPYFSEIFYNGAKEDSHLILSSSPPFTLTLTSSSFAPFSLQTTGRKEYLALNLKASWLDSENLLSKTKENFYSRLLTTLLSFGTYVGVVAVGNFSSYETAVKLEPFKAATMGLSVVSALTLVDSLFQYFRAAKLGL